MKKWKSGSEEAKGGDSPSQRIDARIKELSDWRGETLARVRILIKQAVEPFLKTDRLSDSERAMLMGGACAKAYGWSPKQG